MVLLSLLKTYTMEIFQQKNKLSYLGLVIGLMCFALSACNKQQQKSPPVTKAPNVVEPTKSFETIKIMASDSLEITADLYKAVAGNQWILLFHQANYSRGAYREIAHKLNALGYNCLAIDQRSGETAQGISNETAALAIQKGLSTKYPDAYPDLVAALKYVKTTYGPQSVIVWGSSYSACLVFILNSEFGGFIKGILSFSPGEYFTYKGKSIPDYAAKAKCPVFITSSKKEAPVAKNIFDAVESTNKTHFIPKGKGKHGSQALWQNCSEQAEYWEAVRQFLQSVK